MATELAQEQQAELRKMDGAWTLENNLGNLFFVNTNLASPKLLTILSNVLGYGGFDEMGHGLYSVVFRDDGYPTEEDNINTWAFSMDAQSAICNLIGCVQRAIKDSLDPTTGTGKNTGVWALAWRNIIKGFMHELYHGQSNLNDPHAIRFDEEFIAEDEENATTFANEVMEVLAKQYDLEPDTNWWLYDECMSLVQDQIDAIQADDDADDYAKTWVITQQYLEEHGGTFYAEAEGKDTAVHLTTLKEYIQYFSEDPDSESWNTDTIAVQATVTAEPLTETAGTTYVDPEADPDFMDEDMPFEPDTPVGFGGVQTQQTTPGFQGTTQVVQQQVVQPQTVVQQPVQQIVQQPVQQTPVQTQVGAQVYPPINMAPEQAQHIINGLYLKIARHIFQTLAFQPGNLQQPFMYKDNVKAHMPLDPNEALFIKEMKLENNGQFVQCAGAIQGFFSDRAQQLPTYELKMQMLDGSTCTRRFFPQNPAKRTVWNDPNSAFTPRAIEAQQGKTILWVFDPDVKQYTYIVEDFNVRKL